MTTRSKFSISLDEVEKFLQQNIFAKCGSGAGGRAEEKQEKENNPTTKNLTFKSDLERKHKSES